jgi:hypothetical protein
MTGTAAFADNLTVGSTQDAPAVAVTDSQTADHNPAIPQESPQQHGTVPSGAGGRGMPTGMLPEAIQPSGGRV